MQWRDDGRFPREIDPVALAACIPTQHWTTFRTLAAELSTTAREVRRVLLHEMAEGRITGVVIRDDSCTKGDPRYLDRMAALVGGVRL